MLLIEDDLHCRSASGGSAKRFAYSKRTGVTSDNCYAICKCIFAVKLDLN